MQLMNIKYRCIDSFGKEDFPIVLIDWVKNTKDLRYSMSFEEVPFTGYQIYHDKEKELGIVDYPEIETISAYHKDRDLNGIEWMLSVVFKPQEHELFIRMSNSLTTENGRFMAGFRKPDLIDELIDLHILDMDQDISLEYVPHIVEKEKTEVFLSVLNRDISFTLPVIYIALGPYNTYALDPDKTADIFAGMAHVFVQEDKDCFKELISATEKYVPKNGEVAVYFPNEKLKENIFHFDNASMERSVRKAIHFFYHNQNFGPLTTYEEIASKAIALKNADLKEENKEVLLENERVNKENEEIVSVFDKDLKKNDEEIEKLKRKLIETEKENRILKNRLASADREALLYYGKEKELYTGEIREILTDILKNEVKVSQGSRRAHVIEDLLNCNPPETDIRKRQAKVKTLLSDYSDMTSDLKKGLEELGFSVTADGKHYKLIYHNDSRYQISLSKTPSDHRTGMNIVSYITKNMM